jgi:hypothetical protein
VGGDSGKDDFAKTIFVIPSFKDERKPNSQAPNFRKPLLEGATRSFSFFNPRESNISFPKRKMV